MANIHRRIERQIRAALKKLKRGEIPYPPPPTQATPEEEAQWVERLRERRRTVLAEIERLSRDGSRRGHKRRLRLDQERAVLESLPGLAQ